MYINRTKKTVGLLLAAMMMVPLASLCVAAAQDPVPTPAEPCDWTVMLYMGADNEFYENDVGDIVDFTLKECEKAFGIDLEDGESADDINLVVLVDKRNAISEGVFIYDDSDFSTPVETWKEMNTSDPATLREFINHCSANYPAEKYLLVTKSGHAWCGICPDMDDDKPNVESSEYWMMPIDGLRQAILDSDLGHVDMILLDGDNMASIEILYELRNVVDVFVASQQDVPIDGMPYRLMLGDLIDDPAMSPQEFACRIVTDYISYYNNTMGNKVVMDHLLANSQMAVTASAFETGPEGVKVVDMVDAFMNIVRYMMYGVEPGEDPEGLTTWMPELRPCIASARDFALIGKMADQAGYEWLPDVQSWITMLQNYVCYTYEDWGILTEPDGKFERLAMDFKDKFNASRVGMAQSQILNRSGNSDPNGLNIWFPQNWLHWEDLDMTRTRTYAYDGMGSWVDIPREYYCVDCPLNYSEVGLDFLSDYEALSIEESPHTELWIQFYDIYYDARWLLYSSDSGESKPMTGRS